MRDWQEQSIGIWPSDPAWPLEQRNPNFSSISGLQPIDAFIAKSGPPPATQIHAGISDSPFGQVLNFSALPCPHGPPFDDVKQRVLSFGFESINLPHPPPQGTFSTASTLYVQQGTAPSPNGHSTVGAAGRFGN